MKKIIDKINKLSTSKGNNKVVYIVEYQKTFKRYIRCNVPLNADITKMSDYEIMSFRTHNIDLCKDEVSIENNDSKIVEFKIDQKTFKEIEEILNKSC